MKGVISLILFTILLIIVMLVLGAAILTVGTVGAAGIIVFAEPIICVVLLVMLFRLIFRRKK